MSEIIFSRRSIALAVLGAVLAVLAITSVRPAHGAVSIVVNSTGDEAQNTSSCTFREAITDVNTKANRDGFVDAVDALYLLTYRAGIFLTPQNQPCTQIGSPLA
jgi:CSLREA domain-containing protein